MQTLHSYHAANRGPLTLHFDQNVEQHERFAPKDYAGISLLLEQSRAAYQAEATRIVTAMAQHLPGGLFDAIFGQLCAYKASVFITAHSPVLPAGGP